MGRAIDLTGKIFGDLTILERYYSDKKTKRGNAIWKCKCKCGNIAFKESGDLRKNKNKGLNTSCGRCYQDNYIINDNIVIYFTRKKEPFTFDLKNLEKVKKFIWSLNNEGYVIGSYGKRLHRYILDITNSNVKIDHIDGDKSNNLESNLRECTDAQNIKNQKKREPKVKNKKYTSKYKGVHKRKDGWACTVGYNYKKVHYSRHETEIEAAKMYNKIAPLFHGEFANLNVIKDGK